LAVGSILFTRPIISPNSNSTLHISSFDSPYISAPKAADDNSLVYTINVGQAKPKTLTLYTTGKLAGLATVEFSSMDAWFEEEEEIFLHPKDPYKVCNIIDFRSQTMDGFPPPPPS